MPDSSTNAGVLIRLIQSSDSTYTDSCGKYRFIDPRSDTCTIVASLDGYISQFALVLFDGDDPVEAPDIYLEELPCTPRDSIPKGYPLGVYFSLDYNFYPATSPSSLGDSLYIRAFEYFQPPTTTSASVEYEILIISSLGDSEIKPDDYFLGGIPEIRSFGYIIDSSPSDIPIINNGIVEIEPSGGWVVALYLSHWLDVYVCKSHNVIADRQL